MNRLIKHSMSNNAPKTHVSSTELVMLHKTQVVCDFFSVYIISKFHEKSQFPLKNFESIKLKTIYL